MEKKDAVRKNIDGKSVDGKNVGREIRESNL